MRYDRFEQLPVWQAGVELAVQVYALTAKPEFKNRSSLRDQIERAAVSVSNNIAEGFERGTTQELITFLYIARGSAGEVRSMLCLFERLPVFAGLKSEIANLKPDVSDLQPKVHYVSSLKPDVSDLQPKVHGVSSLKPDVSDLQPKVSGVSSLKPDASDLKPKVSGVSSLKPDVSDLHASDLQPKVSGVSNLKSEISNLKALAESISRQLRAWADSLQNSGIKGQRYLTDKARRTDQAKRERDEFLQTLEQIRQGGSNPARPVAATKVAARDE
jgi:four helix bundle protein